MPKTCPHEVLLVEDNRADRYLIQRAIADCRPHIRVWLVSSGSDALAFLRQELPFVNASSPALILLDLHVPGRHGHAIVAELRGVALYQTTPVVVISGSDRAEERRCLQLGANAYVQKSTDFAAYFGSIQAIIRDWFRGDCALS